MNISLFESAGKQKYNAGSKARQDALKIATDCGYKHITLFHNGNAKPLVALEIIKGCISAIAKAKKEDTVLIQYPYSPMLLNQMLFGVLRLGSKLKGYKISVLIHDLNGLRTDDKVLLQKELKMMRGCSIIYHNESMKNECENIRRAESFQILGIFDYLYSGETCKREYSNKPVIMIAGNLSKEKCGYSYQLSKIDGVRFDLFGVGYNGDSTEKVRYRGKFAPEELIANLDGQFGLVWDGNTLDTCGGTDGNYLRYNNPHKLSLYIAAGVPVIVWKESALAGFVEKNGLGICVNSLMELPEAISKISASDYDLMAERANEMGKLLRQGIYLQLILNDQKI